MARFWKVEFEVEECEDAVDQRDMIYKIKFF